MYLIFIDESGTDSLSPKNKLLEDKRKRFFVEACLILDEKSIRYLRRKYYEILDSIYINGVSIRELFMLYEKLTRKPAELKASYILDKKDPFILLREIHKEQYNEFKNNVFTYVSKALRDSQATLISIVIDKRKLYTINQGSLYHPRELAMDFLFTRIARKLELEGYKEAIVIHDETPKKNVIHSVLHHMKNYGYYYNPNLKHKPNYHLIKRLYFADSSTNMFLQYADILANIIRRKHAYGENQYYSILAGSPRFYVRIYP